MIRLADQLMIAPVVLPLFAGAVMLALGGERRRNVNAHTCLVRGRQTPDGGHASGYRARSEKARWRRRRWRISGVPCPTHLTGAAALPGRPGCIS